MTDNTPKPRVKITLEDALRLRVEMRHLNRGMSSMLGEILRAPLRDVKKDEVEATSKALDELIDRLTIAIHKASKP